MNSARSFGDRSNNFDVLRFALALLVIFTHSYGLLLGPSAREPFVAFTHGQAGGGDLAVDFFFVISGYLITASWLKSGDLFSFLRKRVLRIYPGIIIAIVICLLIVGPLGARHPVDYFRGLSPFTFLRSFVELKIPEQAGVFDGQAYPGALNLSLWTIMYEFLCYLIVAALGIGGLLPRRPLILAAFLVSLMLYSVQALGGGLPMLDWRVYPVLGRIQEWPRFWTFYSAGMVFYLYREQIPRRQWFTWVCVAGILLSSLGGLAITLPILGTYLIMRVAFTDSALFHNFGRYGDFSYGLYIYAAPVQQLLIHYFSKSLTPVSLFLWASPVTLILAFASWHLVERPFLVRHNSAGPISVKSRAALPLANHT